MRSIARTQEIFLKFTREAMLAEHWARQPYFLQRLSVKVKLLCLVAVLVATSFVHNLLLLAAVAALAMGLALAAKIGRCGLTHPIWWAGPFFALVLSLASIFSPFSPGEAAVTIFHRPYFAITYPGLEIAGRLILRVTASVWWIGALLLSSRWDRMLTALRALRIPSVFILSLAMAYRYLFLLVRLSEKALYARRSRTIVPASAQTERALIGSKVAHLFRHSMALSAQVHSAMLARGFSGEYRALETTGMKDEG